MRINIGDEMELRARAYAATASSACWWWPHRDYVLVSERPHTLEKRDGKLWRVEWDGWGCGPGYIQQKEAA